METDASNYALGVILSLQLDSGEIHPVAFHSQTFTPPELNYNTHDKELLAIFVAFRHYLEGSGCYNSLSLPPLHFISIGYTFPILFKSPFSISITKHFSLLLSLSITQPFIIQPFYYSAFHYSAFLLFSLILLSLILLSLILLSLILLSLFIISTSINTLDFHL